MLQSIFRINVSYLVVTCLWIEAEWEDRRGPELVRDLEALMRCRDVQLPVAGIVRYLETIIKTCDIV